MQDGDAAVLFQAHIGAALGETGGAALALTLDPIALGCLDVAQRDLTVEGRRHRADLGLDGRRQLGVGLLFQGLATWDRLLENLRIVQAGPNLVAWRLDTIGARHLHGMPPPAENAGADSTP